MTQRSSAVKIDQIRIKPSIAYSLDGQECVRRPVAEEKPAFFSAYLQRSDGTEDHIIDFWPLDAGVRYVQERFSVVFDQEKPGKSSPSTRLSSLFSSHTGINIMYGEIAPDYLSAVLDEDASVDDRMTGWDEIPARFKRFVLKEIAGRLAANVRLPH